MLTPRFVAILALVSLVRADRRPFSASSFAGATVSAVFPPKVTETFDASALFPVESVVGHVGPTVTGDEAAAIETAPVQAILNNHYPLINSQTLDRKGIDIISNWGNLSPMQSIPSKFFGLPKASPQVPKHCELQGAHIWIRHGARYPAGTSAPAQFAAKLHNAAVSAGFTATDDLNFLNTWTNKLGSEELTAFGRSQMFAMGASTRIQYGTLLKKFKRKPVFFTESEDRMVKSMLNVAIGLFGAPEYQTAYHQVNAIEDPGFNNTGAPYSTCNNSNLPIGNFGDVQSEKWKKIYLQAALKRLQRQLKGIQLTIDDVYAMQQTCAYETVALGYSEFCHLFTAYEWEAFSYSIDIVFWYSNSWGGPTSAATGKGLLEELVARLTKTPIATYDSSTNSTIDNSNVTMPLDQPLYITATHDTILSTLIVAMNLTSLAAGGPLPTDHIPKYQPFKTSSISPFGARMHLQVVSCGGSPRPTDVRFIMNDGVVPMTGIRGCEHSDDGLCDIDRFIAAMKERIAEVDFAFDCLANYTIADPTKITDGRPPPSVRPKAK